MTSTPPPLQDPENVLVLYFVMIHEQDMAKFIWTKSRTPLILALVSGDQEPVNIFSLFNYYIRSVSLDVVINETSPLPLLFLNSFYTPPP